MNICEMIINKLLFIFFIKSIYSFTFIEINTVISKLEGFKKWLTNMGQKDKAELITLDNLKQIYNIVEVRIPQIDTELANLKTKNFSSRKDGRDYQ